MLIYIASLFASSYLLLKDVPENTYQAEVGYFFALIILLTAIVIYISLKHGPKPKWRWGKRDTDIPDEDF